MSTQNQLKFERPVGVRGKYRGSVIIQCPSCQTKFSVSSELLSEQEMPRFHCSRCDHVFDMDAKVQASSESESLLPPPPQTQVTTPPPPPIAPTQETIISPLSGSAQSDSLRSLQIPSKIDQTVSPSAPHESGDSKEFEQIAMNLGDKIAKEKEEAGSDALPYGMSIGKPFFDDDHLKGDLGKEKESSYSPPLSGSLTSSHQGMGMDLSSSALRGSAEIISPEMAVLRQTSPWRGFFVLLTPLLVALALLSVLSFMLARSPDFSETFAESLGSSLPKFPPAGLRVEGIKFNKIVLESGDIIHTIHGRIKNDSVETLSEVILEGLAFNQSGKLIGQSRINAASSLADSRIKSLPLDMIRNLQKAKPNKKFSLAPGAEQQFVVALVDDDRDRLELANAAYFSARIHSVRN